MGLLELDDEMLKRYYLAWTGFDSEWRKRMQHKLQMRLPEFQNPFMQSMSAMMEKAQKKSLPLIAKSFVEAVRADNLDSRISDLATDEAMEAQAKEMLAQLGNPPGMEIEPLIVEMKRSQSLFAFSSANITLRKLLEEMQRAQDIAEEIGVGFEEMLTREGYLIEYLKRRYQPEEYRRISNERLEEQINQLLGFAKSQIELLSFNPAFQGMTARQIEAKKMAIKMAIERRAKKLRKVSKRIIKEEITEIWGVQQKRKREKRWFLRNRVVPRDLQRAFEEFRGPKKGIRFDIIDLIDLPGCSALILRPARTLTEVEKEELGVYIKAKLLCEMPRAVSFLNDKSLVLVRDKVPAIISTSRDGKEFRQPAWYVRHPGGIIGPLTFLTDWDENLQAFVMQLMSAMQRADETLGSPIPPPVIGRIARGYLKGVRSIEI